MIRSERIKSIEEILFSHKFTKKGEEYLFLGDDEELLSFLKSGIERYCKIEASEDICGLKLLSSSDIKGDISSFGDNLLFKINFEGISQNEFIECIESFKSGDNFYRFNNYSFLDFLDKKVKSFMNFLSFIKFNGKEVLIPNGYEELFLEEKEKKLMIPRQQNKRIR